MKKEIKKCVPNKLISNIHIYYRGKVYFNITLKENDFKKSELYEIAEKEMEVFDHYIYCGMRTHLFMTPEHIVVDIITKKDSNVLNYNKISLERTQTGVYRKYTWSGSQWNDGVETKLEITDGKITEIADE